MKISLRNNCGQHLIFGNVRTRLFCVLILLPLQLGSQDFTWTTRITSCYALLCQTAQLTRGCKTNFFSKNIVLFYFKNLFILFERQSYQVWGEGRERVCVFYPLAHSPNGFNGQRGQSTARHQELLLGLSCVCRGPRTWAKLCFHPRCIRREQDCTWSSWDLNSCPHGMPEPAPRIVSLKTVWMLLVCFVETKKCISNSKSSQKLAEVHFCTPVSAAWLFSLLACCSPETLCLLLSSCCCSPSAMFSVTESSYAFSVVRPCPISLNSSSKK